MKIIELFNGRAITVDDEDFDSLSAYQWWTDARGYVFRFERSAAGSKKIYFHRMVIGLESGGGVRDKRQVDHINGDKFDNRRANLRICTQTENQRNRPSKNKWGLKGVARVPTGKWVAQIRMDGKKTHLGSFDTAEHAHEAYCAAADSLYGEFANHG